MKLDDTLLLLIPAADYISFYTQMYDREIGNYLKILSKVNSSKVCNNLLSISIESKEIPSAKEIVECILSSRYFIFAKPETICLAAFIFIHKLMVNIDKSPNYSSYEWSIYRKDEFINLCHNILRNCDKMKFHNNQMSFFENYIENLIQLYIHQERNKMSDSSNIDDDFIME